MYLNKNNKQRQSVCAWEGYENVEMFEWVWKDVVAIYSMYKPVTLNLALFTWISFIISSPQPKAHR